jgi:hypothetical protein
VAGVAAAGLVALTAAALFDDRVRITILRDAPIRLLTDRAYGKDMRMGLLAPGMLRYGDVAHIAALVAPRRLIIAGGVMSKGEKADSSALHEACSFTSGIFKLYNAKDKLVLGEEKQFETLLSDL